MAVQWRWEEKCGEALVEQTIDGKTEEFTLNLYTGNCHLIMLREFEEDGKQMYSMYSFWADKKHMENCLGLVKGKDNIYDCEWQRFKKFSLDVNKCRYWKQIAPALKKAFPDVVVELV